MTGQQEYRPPIPGTRYDDLNDIEPGARPNREPQPAPGTSNRRPRRKVAVARRSRERLAPGNNYFYWCENCDYCNTPAEGQQARCADHQRANEAERKARQRRRAEQNGSDPAEYPVSRELLAEAYHHAERLALAANAYERALHRGNPTAERAILNGAIRSMVKAVTRLPRPAPPP